MSARTSSESARYAVVTAPGAVEIRETAERLEPAADGVVVSITYCGVCGTDTHAYASGGLVPPSVFGHEWTGAIRAVGAEVTDFAVGDRVVACVGPACGHCAQCRLGNPDHCDTAFAEANGVTDDAPQWGGFATELAVSARRVMRVLDGLSQEQAALVEPTAVTFHAVKRARQPFGAIVVVQGAGPIGLLTAQHARHAGAGMVLVVEPSADRRATARALGFAEVHSPGSDFVARVGQVSGGLGADIVYECSGVAGLLQSSGELVRRGGRLALLGFPMVSSEVSYADWQMRELTVVGSLAYNHEDFLGAMRAIADGSVRTQELHTGTVGLDDLERILAELESGQSRHAKVLVDPRR
ncbi:zinc-dependent alcohol dehydrogenase [Actinoalloteichus hymeniacidonis]|uniref:Theronine dehydrogenase-like Zn-dependent dehydrogenase n=1 Tax=Actinoalloteichus hymeniacidonis TaxID=340345 RepID=A0AAC9HQN6_9PSEU|nr:zinc-binding dehydrogenase [Actinoalloteichus hymeniacidonis]AOS63563.1 theronine dehydrogenase-like Zn-dependent dehydrogenase [Actinoalloteichus hymeniacidonis]MBB5908391.1 (R,R)-butanediol dehydrogenase/meso-butanediol dehydrogenase/diacetyl reductase [Actinoalloteichus hymeniacidonis]